LCKGYASLLVDQKLERLKTLEVLLNYVLKATILALILCVVTVIAVAVPWYPVSGTQTSSGQPQAVYTLPSPVNLAGYCGVACWVSESFSLQPGTIQVTVAECQYCEVYVDNINASYNAAVIGPVSPLWLGLGVPSPLTETAKVVDAGNYHVILGNEGDLSGTVSSLVVVNTPTSAVPEFSSPTVILIISVFVFVVASTAKQEEATKGFT
jgi:hypothetical protein